MPNHRGIPLEEIPEPTRTRVAEKLGQPQGLPGLPAAPVASERPKARRAQARRRPTGWRLWALWAGKLALLGLGWGLVGIGNSIRLLGVGLVRAGAWLREQGRRL